MSQRLGVNGLIVINSDVAGMAKSILVAWEGGQTGVFEAALRGVDEMSSRRFRPIDSLEAERMEVLESAVQSLRERRAFEAEIRAAVHILQHLANPPLCLAQAC